MDEQYLLYESSDILRDTTLLSENGIPSLPLRITIPRQVSGLGFPLTHQDRAFELLHIHPASRIGGTNLRSVQLISSAVFEVLVERSGGLEAWADLRPIVEEFAQVAQKRVHVINFHGDTGFHTRLSPDGIWLTFWSAPGEVRPESQRHHRVFGHEMAGGQEDGYEPTMIGMPIVDEEGQIHAEVAENVIYVLYDLPHRSGVATATALRDILATALPLMTAGGDYQARLEAAQAARRASSRKRFIDACASYHKSRLTHSEERLGQLTSRINDYSSALVEASREREELTYLVAAGTAVSEQQMGLFESSYEALQHVDGIEAVEVVARSVRLFTAHLVTDEASDGHRHDLGKYILTIPFEGGTILAANTTRTINGRHHPHDVGGNGQLCLGNAQDGMMKLISQYEFPALAEFLIAFLQRPNEEDSMGRRVLNWPAIIEES